MKESDLFEKNPITNWYSKGTTPKRSVMMMSVDFYILISETFYEAYYAQKFNRALE